MEGQAKQVAVQPLQQENAPALIGKQLRSLIAAGHLAPGERLNEALLSKEFGVSRGPLREAIGELAQEGLVRRERNRGAFVAEFTPEDIHDLYVARAAIEHAAADQILAGDYATAGEQLLAAGERMRDMERAGDITRLRDADMDFHTLLVELSGSRHLQQIHQTLIVETKMCMVYEVQNETYKHDPDLHCRIAEEIRDGVSPEAHRLIARHMRGIEDVVVARAADA